MTTQLNAQISPEMNCDRVLRMLAVAEKYGLVIEETIEEAWPGRKFYRYCISRAPFAPDYKPTLAETLDSFDKLYVSTSRDADGGKWSVRYLPSSAGVKHDFATRRVANIHLGMMAGVLR